QAQGRQPVARPGAQSPQASRARPAPARLVGKGYAGGATTRSTEPSVWKSQQQATGFLRKEVIQPQVPLRLPCYDFTPVADLTVAGCLPCGLAHRLRVKPTPMV